MTHKNYNSTSTHIASLELDVNENLLDVLCLCVPTLRWRAAWLQVTWEAVLHPLLPRQHLPLLSLLFTKCAHLSPKLIHLVVLLGLKFMQT